MRSDDSTRESATKARIRAAAAAVFDRMGIAGLTMRAIAREAGLSATAIYRHYINRDAILRDVWELGYEDLTRVMEQPITSVDPGEQVVELTERYVRWALRQSEIYELKNRYDPNEKDLLKRRHDGEVGDLTNAPLIILVSTIESALASGRWREQSAWQIALAIWALAHGLVSLHRSEQISVSEAEIISIGRTSMTMLIQGLEAR